MFAEGGTWRDGVDGAAERGGEGGRQLEVSPWDFNWRQ